MLARRLSGIGPDDLGDLLHATRATPSGREISRVRVRDP
ncbi:hypothetical protein JOD49_001256 [Oerskovia jenensis]|uniref:Uncharacterized protein n=1 Tax=Oerskovia jenensis TaxID=162169 RepID=A0ABS2LD38_9CELL|nr:hypothetical protein [Oerskovia jenensis]